MKYHDTEFSDGTEPTVRRVPLGCDQQGRHPEAAEPVTDIGQEDEPAGEDTTWFWAVIGSAVLVFALGLVAAVLEGKV